MSLRVFAAFDFARIGTGTMTLDDDGAAAPVTFSSGVYCHVNISATVSTVLLWSSSLKSAMDTASTGAGVYTVTFAESTQAYTISYSAGNFDLTFSGAAGTVMQNILGFTGNKTGSSSYTSDVAAYYAIDGTVGAKSDPFEYEPDGIVAVSEADDGKSYGIARSTAPVYYDCMITFEPEARVRTRKLAAAYPWTWQRFFEHVRGHEYFAMKDSALSENTVHKLRAECVFSPQSAASDPNYVSYYNIALKTYFVGTF